MQPFAKATKDLIDYEFQSSPAPEGECNIIVGRKGSPKFLVSILTRP